MILALQAVDKYKPERPRQEPLSRLPRDEPSGASFASLADSVGREGGDKYESGRAS